MQELNTYIDHTLLRPEATQDQIKILCEEVIKYNFRSACVSSYWTPEVFRHLQNTKSLIATTIGFPHGNCSLVSKVLEIDEAIVDGADELDVVLNIGNVKSKKWNEVEEEISEVAKHAQDKTIKYIIEVGHLDDFETYKICDILIKSGINYVKTCTGYGPRSVTVDDIKKLYDIIKNTHMKIKASGGIKDKSFALELIGAGASIIGCSKSVSILTETTNAKAVNMAGC